MNYYNPIVVDNMILSCDKLRLNFNLSEVELKQFNLFLNKFTFGNTRYTMEYYKSFVKFDYKHMITIKDNVDKSTYQMGLCLNSVKQSERDKCFIEFNPNKCISSVTPVINYLRAFVRLELNRFDLAIDIKLKRNNVYLHKDSRTYRKFYGLIQNDKDLSNFTEYLGQRNNNGYVKLYNKTIESNLDYDLTRLEITLDTFSFDNFKSICPTIYKLNEVTLLDYDNLTASDKVLLDMLIQSQEKNIYFNKLGRKQQDKIGRILFNIRSVDISESDFYRVIINIKELVGV